MFSKLNVYENKSFFQIEINIKYQMTYFYDTFSRVIHKSNIDPGIVGKFRRVIVPNSSNIIKNT